MSISSRTPSESYNFTNRTDIHLDEVGYRETSRGTVHTDSTQMGGNLTRGVVRMDRPRTWDRGAQF